MLLSYWSASDFTQWWVSVSFTFMVWVHGKWFSLKDEHCINNTVIHLRTPSNDTLLHFKAGILLISSVECCFLLEHNLEVWLQCVIKFLPKSSWTQMKNSLIFYLLSKSHGMWAKSKAKVFCFKMASMSFSCRWRNCIRIKQQHYCSSKVFPSTCLHGNTRK